MCRSKIASLIHGNPHETNNHMMIFDKLISSKVVIQIEVWSNDI